MSFLGACPLHERTQGLCCRLLLPSHRYCHAPDCPGVPFRQGQQEAAPLKGKHASIKLRWRRLFLSNQTQCYPNGTFLSGEAHQVQRVGSAFGLLPGVAGLGRGHRVEGEPVVHQDALGGLPTH